MFAESQVVGSLGTHRYRTEHLVHFYGDDALFIRELAAYVADTLAAGQSSVVIASAAHRQALEGRLHALGVDVAAARADDRYIEADASETVDGFVRDGAIDATAFADAIGTILMRAIGNGDHPRQVRAFGEMVAILCERGRYDLARELEALWVALARRVSFSLFCAYPGSLFRDEQRKPAVSGIAALHDRVAWSPPPLQRP